MSLQPESTNDVVVIGGGFSGLSIAALLAQNNIPVTVLEASDLGTQASTVNQGWLYSGAWFARRQSALARMCHDAWKKTIQFCPDCLEPGHTGMVFAMTSDSDEDAWTRAWDAARIPWKEVSASKIRETFPASDIGCFRTGMMLPDRSFRPEVLLRSLADTALAHGARIHTGARVTRLNSDDNEQTIASVVTGRGEEIRASFVIIATGASESDFSHYLMSAEPRSQNLYTRVTLQAHLIATPQQTSQPYCIPDWEGFNHLPHLNPGDRKVSVFGIDRWKPVTSLETHDSSDTEFAAIEDRIRLIHPQTDLSQNIIRRWSGTTVQAMHIDQIEPGQVPLPTVIDHSLEPPVINNLLSVYPGRATLWTRLAEDCADVVLQRLQPATSQTADPPWAS